MPFAKVGTNNYTGPSGKHFDLAQVRLYYANGGKFPGQKKKESSGGLLGRTLKKRSNKSRRGA